MIFTLAGQAVVIELEAVVNRFTQEHSLPSETHRRLADVCSHRRVLLFGREHLFPPNPAGPTLLQCRQK